MPLLLKLRTWKVKLFTNFAIGVFWAVATLRVVLAQATFRQLPTFCVDYDCTGHRSHF
jgi:hypothetical protein